MQAKRNPAKTTQGIVVRHSRSCSSDAGGECDCSPTFRAFVYVPRHGKVWKSFPTVKDAVAWREDQRSKQRRGQSVRPTRMTLRVAAEEWLAGAKAGTTNRSGRPYKPSVLRMYEGDRRKYVLPDLGSVRLTDVRRGDLQALVERMLGDGLSASKAHNVIVATRVVSRHALDHDRVAANPATGLRGRVPPRSAVSTSRSPSREARRDLRDIVQTRSAFGQVAHEPPPGRRLELG